MQIVSYRECQILFSWKYKKKYLKMASDGIFTWQAKHEKSYLGTVAYMSPGMLQQPKTNITSKHKE